MKKVISFILLIIVAVVLYMSISFLNEKKEEKGSTVYDVTRVVEINDKKLRVKFLKGNMIDEELIFGNVFTKDIEITNDNDEDINYSITFKEVNINNEALTYSLKVTKDKKEYVNINNNELVIKDMHLGYNLVIEPNTTLYITIEFKANYEESTTKLKGILNIENNLSEGDLFLNNTKKIVEEIKVKIKDLNGIVDSGYYILNLEELSSEIYEKYKGYIIVDANNISEIKYVFFVYSNSFMLKNYIYDSQSDKSIFKSRDEEISSLNMESVCDLYTKKDCQLFSSLKYNNKENRGDFYKETKRIINIVRDSFDTSIKKNMVYNIKEDIDSKAKVRGYILVNNADVSEANYYIYLTNDIYMISGYNLTKNGDYDEESSTIREYNETAFRLSAKDKLTVCSFSGFKTCVDSDGITLQ